ncbi:hypothetical protein BC833DRAFT_574838 [Globomyces pollinis-pini]|nr:hypothetical protein BC833DRAFT_574838 [Globomyces pollinis-pini]
MPSTIPPREQLTDSMVLSNLRQTSLYETAKYFNQPHSYFHPQTPTINLNIQGERLFIQGVPYSKNDKAYLYDSGTKFTVKLVHIGAQDLTVQRTDGSKTKLSFSLLMQGRVSLSRS